MHLQLPLEINELSIYDSYAIYEFTHLRFYAPGVHVRLLISQSLCVLLS